MSADRTSGAPRAASSGESADYDASLAAAYWSEARHEGGDELSAVLSLGEPAFVNEAYDAWESGLLLEALDALAATGRRRALDLGAGVGRVALRIAPKVGRLACGDLAPGMLRRLRENAARAGVSNIDLVRLRSDRLPLRDRSISLVVCLGLLEHLPAGARRSTLAEAARVLAPGGVLALVLNNDRSAFLRESADNPHRVGAQRANGYYCDLVPRRGILEALEASFRARALGSNLFYSLQRHAARRLDAAAGRDRRLAPFFASAAAWDRALLPLGPLPEEAADHHLYVLVRR